MSEADTEEFESGRLFELYTKYVTEPESKRDVYGYTILVVGYLLGMAGMVVFLVGPSGGELDPMTILVREIAFPSAGLGLVVTLFGIVLMLPVKTKGVIVGILGTAMGIGAAGWFVVAYPNNWSVGTPDYSAQIITLYTVGVALVAGVVVMVPIITGERSYFAAAREVLGTDHPDIMLGQAARGGLFTVFRQGSDWTWRLIDQSAVASSSEDFLSRLETEDRVDRVKEKIEQAALLEITHAAFRLYQVGEDRWRWLLMQGDGNVVADSGDEYPSREAAEDSVNELKEFGPAASVFAIDEAAFETYPENGSWRWRLLDHQRRTLADGPTRHAEREAAHAASNDFATNVTGAPVLTIEEYGVELYETDDQWRWRLLDANLDTLADGSADFGNKGRAEDAVYETIDGLASAAIVPGDQSTYDVYESGDGEWDWRLVTPERRTIATPPESTGSEQASTDAARTFRKNAPGADTVEIRDQDFELYQMDGGWHWRLVDGDRNTRAHSVDTYPSQSGAADAIEDLRVHAPDADLIEFEKAAFQIYEADEGRWRWRLIDEDGNVLADSSEGEYESRDGATSAMTTLKEYAPDAEQLEIENAAFELFEESGRWGWRLVDDIGETIARGERRYDTRSDAQDDMDALRDEVSGLEARVMDAGVFQVYHDSSDEWWWRFILPDGTTIARSPDSFGTRHEAEDAIETLLGEHVDAEVVSIGRLAVLLDDVGDQWSWQIIDQDRDPIAEGTGAYPTRSEVRSVVSAIRSAAESITVFEIRDAAFLVTDGDGWEWSLLDESHDPIATGPTTYEEPALAEDAVGTIQDLAPDAEHIEFDRAAFEVHESADGWQWQLLDEDRSVIAASTQVYDTRREVEATIEAIRDELSDASILEIERAAFEFHESDGGWRWRLIDETGNELAESLVAYETRTEARDVMNAVKEYGPEAWTSVAD